MKVRIIQWGVGMMLFLFFLVPSGLQAQEACPFLNLMDRFGMSAELDGRSAVITKINDVTAAGRNPDNKLAYLPEWGTCFLVETRLTIYDDAWLFQLEPQLRFQYEEHEVMGQQLETRDADLELRRFKIRRGLSDTLFVSYGWENMQWGPSFLYSPSNLFFNDNGKKDSLARLPGKGILSLLWVYDYKWSASLIINTDHGAVNESGFEKGAAVKIEYSGDEAYASLVFSHREDQRNRLGLYGGATVSDAVLIYGEAGFEKGSDALYPVNIAPPLCWDMQMEKKDSDRIYTTFLAGLSYTTPSADTFTFEYLYYGEGYDDHQASRFFNLVRDADRLQRSTAPWSGYGMSLLGSAAQNRLDFLRRHYVMLQYMNEDIVTDVDLVCRATLCLDDRSSRLYAAVTYALNDLFDVSLTGVANPGKDDSSFGGFFDYQVLAALEISF